MVMTCPVQKRLQPRFLQSVHCGDSYGYNYVELEHARMANVNLEARKALSARRGIDLKLNNIAWFGDAEHGILGFINNPNIANVTIPADGTGSSA